MKFVVKTFKEYTALIVAVALFFLSQGVLRFLDPMAAPYDAGVLQTIIISVIAFCVFQAVTWTVVKNIWPGLGKYATSGQFDLDFKTLEPWQRQKLFLFIYSLLFVLLTLLFLKKF